MCRRVEKVWGDINKNGTSAYDLGISSHAKMFITKLHNYCTYPKPSVLDQMYIDKINSKLIQDDLIYFNKFLGQ